MPRLTLQSARMAQPALAAEAGACANGANVERYGCLATGSGRRTVQSAPSWSGHPCHADQVRAYWEALRRGGAVCRARADIDPRGIGGALERVFLVERIAPGHGAVSAGRHATLTDLVGMDVRGMPLSALFEPDGAHAVLPKALEQVFADPARSWICAWRPSAASAARRWQARMMLLPLRGDAGEADLALGLPCHRRARSAGVRAALHRRARGLTR